MKVKGNVLLSRIAFVQKHFGEAGWEKVLAALPPEDARLYSGLVAPVGWYSFETGKRFDDTIVRVLGNGDPKAFEQIGASSARENLSTVHKSFLSPGDPQRFMSKAPVIYGFYYDTGRRTHEATGPNSCVLTTHDADEFSEVDCMTVLGWHKEALTMCGAQDVTGVQEKCRARLDDTCRYVFRWR
jgi:hypothetical protein